ncbi:MAG TPA: 4Fe-4S binding protein [Candidatus Eremiobacteraeota bacterium]|nr:MAG: 2-ketoisovalerate ferredoxin oxidoreductase subunit delta [bacterium ADurb.Bin363]HPZ07982.1 4Fe-4S binding protein [Candidatus Eremiobacteraeota bacterium]
MEEKEGLEHSRVVIDFDLCKGCGLCIKACPKGQLVRSTGLNVKGFRPAQFSDDGKCIGCAICFYACPEPAAIAVYKKGFVKDSKEGE